MLQVVEHLFARLLAHTRMRPMDNLYCRDVSTALLELLEICNELLGLENQSLKTHLEGPLMQLDVCLHYLS